MVYEATRERDDVVHAESVNLSVGYLLLARELARRDIEQARAVTGLPRAFLEVLAQTTVDALRKNLTAVQGPVVFVPRLPLSYWDHLAAALREQSVSVEMLAGYAAALSVRFGEEGEMGHDGQG